MGSKKYILISSICLAIILAYLIVKVNHTPRIAYVKSSDVIYGYLGMKEAQRKQALEEEVLNHRLDSLKFSLEKDIREYNATYQALDKREQYNRKVQLQAQENDYKSYSQHLQEKIKQSDQELTSGVLNQINSFIENYGTQQDYDLVLGTTASGNILFAKNYLDITEEVLKALNKSYKPGTK